MKKFILAALVALPLSILAQQRATAGDCGACCFSTPPVGLTFGFRFQLKGGLMLKGPPPCGGCCGSCCGCGSSCDPCCGGGGGAPWYNYYPLDSHFQTPAPTGYPYWPSAMGPMQQHCNAGYGVPPMAYGYNYAIPQPPMGYGYNYAMPQPPMAYGGNYAMPQQPMVAGSTYGPPMPPMALPMPPSMNYSAPPTVQPCGYSPNGAPSYWYGR